MKNKNQKTGVWLDTRSATIITVDEVDSIVTEIDSGIDEVKPKGGARSNVPYGPMDKVSEHKFLERRRHQELNYFDRLIDKLKQFDAILIFGPAQMKDKFSARIRSRKEINLQVENCIQADSMTGNQKVAFVRDYFNIGTRIAP